MASGWCRSRLVFRSLVAGELGSPRVPYRQHRTNAGQPCSADRMDVEAFHGPECQRMTKNYQRSVSYAGSIARLGVRSETSRMPTLHKAGWRRKRESNRMFDMTCFGVLTTLNGRTMKTCGHFVKSDFQA